MSPLPSSRLFGSQHAHVCLQATDARAAMALYRMECDARSLQGELSTLRLRLETTLCSSSVVDGTKNEVVLDGDGGWMKGGRKIELTFQMRLTQRDHDAICDRMLRT